MYRSVVLVLILMSAWTFGACSVIIGKKLDDKSADGGAVADLRVDGPKPGDRGPGEGIVPPNDAGPGENMPPPRDSMPDMPQPPPPSFCPTSPILVPYSRNLLFNTLSLSADSQGVIGLAYATGSATPEAFDAEPHYGFFAPGISGASPTFTAWTASVSGWKSSTVELFTMATAQAGPPDRVHFFATERPAPGQPVKLHHLWGDPGGNPANITHDQTVTASSVPIELAAAAGPGDVVYLVTIEPSPPGGGGSNPLSIWVATPKGGGGYDYKQNSYPSAGQSPSFPSIALSPDGTQVAVSFVDSSIDRLRLIHGGVGPGHWCPADVSEIVTTVSTTNVARFPLTVLDGGEVDLAGLDSSGDLKAWRCMSQQSCTESTIASSSVGFFAESLNLLRQPGSQGMPSITDTPPVTVTYLVQPPAGSPELHVAHPTSVTDPSTGELHWEDRGAAFPISGNPGQIATTLWSGDTTKGPGDAVHLAFEDLSTTPPRIQYVCQKLR